MTDITALRADLLVAEAAFTAASKEAQDAQAKAGGPCGTLTDHLNASSAVIAFYAAATARDRARAAVRVAEREAAGA